MRPRSLAVAFAAVVGGVLVILEFIMREVISRGGGGRTVLASVCDAVHSFTPLDLHGWACLLPPVILAFLFGLLMDWMALGRSKR